MRSLTCLLLLSQMLLLSACNPDEANTQVAPTQQYREQLQQQIDQANTSNYQRLEQNAKNPE